ncbi:hypothetical protein PBI_MOZY_44 [Mycobacterium phage Mozy]|uniref:Uncharacterized protein n=2 Tax=Gracegardnervirinae TaxID=2946632 RepID=Q855R9_9CAUD|nr:hypothetical protein PBI_CHE9D_44 [Mycobacterium phage Che9d]YP_009637184.1 hypothetical protein FGG28_gp044 [Mycobacterium phage Mozy]AAN07962.1 hypothetical protein PBI_CHE9D_44 [Mycobacterium phage Che9d]AEK09658.1 hypothetical protein PBI_MOZY_44 [Mycobacterium phage Mozy]
MCGGCEGDYGPTGEIRFHRAIGGRLTVEHADPVVWFSKHALDALLERPDPMGGWMFDGSLVTLDVANGRWVWKLTGRSWCHEYGPGTVPLVMLEAVWPD